MPIKCKVKGLATKPSAIQSVLAASLIAVTATPALADEDKIEHILVEGQRANDLKVKDTTVSKMDVAIKDIGRSMTVLDSDELDIRAIDDIREAFNYVAGFRGNGPADRTYTARGVRTSIDNVMVDGLRSLQGGEAGTGSRLPSTFNAESATFVRGPEALLYGAGVAGGLVNIVTKKPKAEAATTIGIQNKSYVSDDTGDFKRNDTQFTLDSTGPVMGENLLYRLLGQHTPSGDHFQEGRELEETLIDFALTAQLGEATTITPRIEYADRSRTGGSSYADGVFERNFFKGEITEYGEPVNRGEYYGSDKDKGDNESKSASLEINHEFNDDWSLSAKYRHSSTESDSLDLYISDSSALQNEIGKDEINRKWVFSKGDDSYDLFDIATQGKFTLGDIQHHVLAGYNYRDLDVKFERNFQSSEEAFGQNTISASNPSQQSVGPIPEGLTTVDFSPKNQKDTNIYLKDRITIDSTTVVAGVAYIKQEQSESRSGNHYEKDYSDTIWDFGVVQKLNHDVNVFATYSRAYQPVSARHIAQYGQGKTDYDAVEGNNYELGLKADLLKGDLSTAITLFKLERENSTKFERNENGYLLTQISGKSFESKGVEIDSTYYFGHGFSSTLSYAYTRAHDTIGDDEGVQADNTPKHSIALWNSYELDKHWSFSLGGRYESERNDGNFVLKQYFELDAGAYYEKDDWKASLVISNAFDKNRAEAGANWVTVQPNEPRSVNLSISYTL